jgi:hypothetical protein
MWITDPTTKLKSVSLTMLAVSFVVVLVSAGLHMADKVKDTSVVMELFYTTAALYFSRRVSIKGKDFEASPSQLKETEQPK